MFDGVAVLGVRDVLITGGRIADIGSDLDVADAQVIDGSGRTLLPGLIDAHTHTIADWWLTQALAFGVTTHLDMFGHPGAARRLRAEQDHGDATDRADLFSSGYLATAPNGHGTQFGLPVPTLTNPSEADQWVADRLEEGSDYIKIIVEDRGDFEPLDPAVVEALVDSARDRGVLTVAHAMRRPLARQVIEAGVDGLAHVFTDQPPTDELVALAVDNQVFLITTLSVFGSSHADRIVLDDDRLRDWLPSGQIDDLEQAASTAPADPDAARVGMQVTRAWHDAGLPVLAGTDLGNAGVVAGASPHAELELLVDAGLDPAAALRAATAAPADQFGLNDRGRIETGRRADLLLVDGDPTSDVIATRNIHAIWKGGHRADPASLLTQLPDQAAS